MKPLTSVIVASGLTLALWGGISGRALLAQAEAGPTVASPPPPPSPAAVKTDQSRRAELNMRLRGMIAEGRGGRLTDAPRAAPVAQPSRRQAPVSAKTPSPRDPVRTEPRATITPPPYDAAKALRTSARRGYTAPRLDLTTPATIPQDPLACLTQAIYYEARSESEEGQAAVAEVILNRAASGRYPRDICQVVYQRNSRTCQFTFTCDGSIGRFPVNPVAWGRAERIAREVYTEGYQAILPKRSVNYHANYVRPRWASQLERVNRIGAHIFYGSPLGGFSTPGAERTTQPSSERGLLFVRNEEIERAYALLTGKTDRSGS